MVTVSDVAQGKAKLTAELYTAKCIELDMGRVSANEPYHKLFAQYKVVVVMKYCANFATRITLASKDDDSEQLEFLIPDQQFVVLSNQSLKDLVEEYILTQKYYKLYQSSIAGIGDKFL